LNVCANLGYGSEVSMEPSPVSVPQERPVKQHLI
jgi:hypothetical protein